MTTRLEQIKARLEAATDGYPLPWTWWKCGDYAVLASGIQGDDYEHPHGERIVMDDGSACGEYGPSIEPESTHGILLAHAPADLAALLRIAEAAERWEEAWYATDLINYRDQATALAAAVRAFREGGGEG